MSRGSAPGPDTLIITQAGETDYPEILMLNERAVPSVNLISAATLRQLHGQAVYLAVARTADELAGFLLVLPHNANYQSPNFQYFRQRYPAFAYVDRVVVAEGWRSRGVGAALYEDLETHLGRAFPLLTCEVNIEPPNPGSLRFHQRLGFRPVGSQETEGGTKRVTLLARNLL